MIWSYALPALCGIGIGWALRDTERAAKRAERAALRAEAAARTVTDTGFTDQHANPDIIGTTEGP